MFKYEFTQTVHVLGEISKKKKCPPLRGVTRLKKVRYEGVLNASIEPFWSLTKNTVLRSFRTCSEAKTC